MGPAKWSYFYLYVIIDIFSRRIVGWCVADRESATLFMALFKQAVAQHPAPAGQLTLHADRGGPMRAKATALLLADLGVSKSHSRPHTSNDNPFSATRPTRSHHRMVNMETSASGRSAASTFEIENATVMLTSGQLLLATRQHRAAGETTGRLSNCRLPAHAKDEAN